MFSILLAVIAAFNGQDIPGCVKLPAPGVNFRPDVASATTAPWVDSNGWRIARAEGKKVCYDVPQGRVTLAMAEADAHHADATIKFAPEDQSVFDKMTEFLRKIGPGPTRDLGDIAVKDDGSTPAGEALNLLTRRNLTFRLVSAPDPKATINITLDRSIKDPNEFVYSVRQRLTDEKRLLRVYGSEIVLANLTGDGAGHLRVHLVNYGRRGADGMRVRVRGSYQVQQTALFGVDASSIDDYSVADGGTEFSIPHLETYSVIDLVAKP
jgi:hypothetical protein